MSEAYNRSVAVKAMVLFEIQKAGGSVLGSALVDLVEEAGRRASARVPDYDFVGWIGCTIWGLLSAYLDKGWITASEQPHWNEMYLLRRATITMTERGAGFIGAVRAEAPEQLAYFD